MKGVKVAITSLIFFLLPTSAVAESRDTFFLLCEINENTPLPKSTVIYKIERATVYQWSEFNHRFIDVCKSELVRLDCDSSVTSAHIGFHFTIPISSENRSIYVKTKVAISRYSGQYVEHHFPLDNRDAHLTGGANGICARTNSPEISERKF